MRFSTISGVALAASVASAKEHPKDEALAAGKTQSQRPTNRRNGVLTLH